MSIDEKTVLLAIQQAMLGEIGPNLRAVILKYHGSTLEFECYFDGEISNEDSESMSCVETELIAFLPENILVRHTVHRLDAPSQIPKKAVWVYYRREIN